jgi:hypothetical protein
LDSSSGVRWFGMFLLLCGTKKPAGLVHERAR